jgi:POT family proton-dependent oligopeptide transporter
MVFITVAYSIIVIVSTVANGPTLLSPLLIIPAYLMISFAELFLSPVGLSAITVLADKDKVSTMMGIFFVSLGIGGFLSGKLATLTAIPQGETNLLVLKSLYSSAFTQQLGILFIATLCCVVLFAVIKFLLIKVQIIE